MGLFLLALFIIFILIPVGRVIWAVFRLRSQARKSFSRFEQNMRAAGEEYRRDTRPGGWQKAAPQKKKIDRTQGEYVEWEEVAVSDTSARDTDEVVSGTHFEAEQQIVDVEWEDVR